MRPYIMKSRLKLIFVDVHSDPATYSILEKLAPLLSKMGYTKFFAEYRKKWNIDSIMETDKQTMDFCDRINEIANNNHFDMNQLNLNKKEDFVTLTATPAINQFIRNNPLGANAQQELRRGTAKRAEYNFLKVLKDINIAFQPICSENSIYSFQDKAFLVEADDYMAKAYINTNEEVFGTMGIAHIKGVQDILLNTSTHQDVCFFHLYSTAETLMEKNKQQATADFPDLERKLRSDKNYFPMPIESINIAELTEAAIINIIISKMENHSAKKNININSVVQTRFNFEQYYKPNQTSLDLSYQKNMTSEDIPYLFNFLNQHPEITCLNLYGCELGNNRVTTLAQELASNNTLTSIVLRQNFITDVGAIALAEALTSNTKLYELSLGFNKIGDRGAFALSNTGLKILDLFDNAITNQGAKCFFINTKLIKISLLCNRVNEDTQVIIKDRIRKNKPMHYALSSFHSCSIFEKAYKEDKTSLVHTLVPEILDQIYVYVLMLNNSVIVNSDVFIKIVQTIIQQSNDKEYSQLINNDVIQLSNAEKCKNAEIAALQWRIEGLQVLKSIINHSTFWRNRGKPGQIMFMLMEFENYHNLNYTPFKAWENMKKQAKCQWMDNPHKDLVDLCNAIVKGNIDALHALEMKAVKEESEYSPETLQLDSSSDDDAPWKAMYY